MPTCALENSIIAKRLPLIRSTGTMNTLTLCQPRRSRRTRAPVLRSNGRCRLDLAASYSLFILRGRDHRVAARIDARAFGGGDLGRERRHVQLHLRIAPDSCVEQAQKFARIHARWSAYFADHDVMLASGVRSVIVRGVGPAAAAHDRELLAVHVQRTLSFSSPFNSAAR